MLPTTYFITVTDKLKPKPNPNNSFFSRSSKFNTQVSKVNGEDNVNEIKQSQRKRATEGGAVSAEVRWGRAVVY